MKLPCLKFLSSLQVVIFVSQIRVNSMTIICMKSVDGHGTDEFGRCSSEALTSNVEQVFLYFML